MAGDLTFRSETDGGDNSLGVSSVNAGLPTGTASGDWQVLWVGTGVAAPASAPGVSTPSGWTSRGSGTATIAGGLFNVSVQLFTKLAGGSEGTETLATVGGVNAAITFIRKSYQNPDASAPFGQVTFGSGASAGTVALSSITTTADRALIDAYIAQGTAQTITPPGSMTERAENGTLGISSADEIFATAGATGTRTFTFPTNADSAWGFAEFHSATLPVITVQPTSQTTNNGATATFSVTATGATSYQWKKNGTNVSGGSGGTTASYTTPAVSYSDQGALYTCDCTNANGTTTSSAATLRVAFNLSGTGPRAYPLFGGGPFGAGSFGTFYREPAAAGGGATVSGQTLTASASLIAGSVTASSSVAGQTLTATASLIAGSATGQANATVSGQTLTATASLIAGSATASADIASQTLTATASLLAGTASGSGNATVNGQTLTATASPIAGSVQADSSVAGQTLSASASLIAGSVQATSVVAGQTLSASASLIAGSALADSAVTGQTLTATASLNAGSASGAGAATVNGQTLTALASLIDGVITADSSVAGQILTVNATILAGSAFGPSAGGASQSKPLQIGIGIGM